MDRKLDLILFRSARIATLVSCTFFPPLRSGGGVAACKSRIHSTRDFARARFTGGTEGVVRNARSSRVMDGDAVQEGKLVRQLACVFV